MAYPFYTIGHGTRPIGEFIDLLQSVKVTLVADVRTMPRSRTNPQSNGDALPPSLATFGIRYEHIAALGGLRGRERGVPVDVNAFWQNESFHNYADYAMGDGFRAALSRRATWGATGAAPSCALKRYGGAATGVSSPIICWRRAKPSSTCSGRKRSNWRR